MTFTELKAKPGQYIWNENQTQFVGRINKDGTEDKRFSRGGVCSMLNNIIKETGYVPTNPQVFATKIAEHKSNNYLVKGYGVIVKCYDLSAEMWVAKAAEHLGVEGDGIADILKHVSKSKTSEHKAKIETLALIFGKELKSSKLSDYAGVSEFEERLKQERRSKSVKAKKERERAELEVGMEAISEKVAAWVVMNEPYEIDEAIRLSDKYNSLWCYMAVICGFKKLPQDVKKEFYKAHAKPFNALMKESRCLSLGGLLAQCANIKYLDEKYKDDPKAKDYLYGFKKRMKRKY